MYDTYALIYGTHIIFRHRLRKICSNCEHNSLCAYSVKSQLTTKHAVSVAVSSVVWIFFSEHACHTIIRFSAFRATLNTVSNVLLCFSGRIPPKTRSTRQNATTPKVGYFRGVHVSTTDIHFMWLNVCEFLSNSLEGVKFLWRDVYECLNSFFDEFPTWMP